MENKNARIKDTAAPGTARAKMRSCTKRFCAGVAGALLAVLLWAPVPTARAAESTDYGDYVNILYNSENGLPTSESNDIVQSPDGFIWVASYSGLIRYDGRSFVRLSDEGGVASANTVFIDAKGRLWVGSNDNGAMLYENGEYTVYNRARGLPSNSVRVIEEDSRGRLYIGTTAGLACIDPETQTVQAFTDEKVCDAYITSMEVLYDDTLLCVTNTGKLFSVRDGAAAELLWNGNEPLENVISVYAVPGQARWFLGTESNRIYECAGTPEDFRVKEYECGTLNAVNEIKYLSDGTLWICSDSGVGYFDTDGALHILSEFAINNSVDNMMEDFEGNLWFSSARQGVFKCTKNYFTDLSKKAGLDTRVINSIVRHDGVLYAGTDTGLVALDGRGAQTENALTDYLNGVRVRGLTVDGAGRLWLSTYGATGLVCWDGQTITSLSEADGIASSKVRSALAARDGSIYAATANGIYRVKDFRVVERLGASEGLTNLEVLSMVETDDGTLYAGTDGGGVCVIRDGRVVDCISEEDGMHSGIVMRVRYDAARDGFWFVTSNSLAFCKDGTVTNIDKFPYSNNYDIYFGSDDTMWILSSNGLYVTRGENLLNDASLVYTFYNYNSGMPSTPTANSFSFQEESSGMLYICGSRGLFRIRMSLEEEGSGATKLAVPDVVADGETVWVKDGSVRLPTDVKRLRVDAYVLNYGLENPLVEYSLEGFDEEKQTVRQSDFEGAVYTNLAGGDYVFHLAVLDPADNTVLREISVRIEKQKRLSEYGAFPVLVIVALGLAMSGASYIAMRLWMNQRVVAGEEVQKQLLTEALETARSASEAKGQFLSRMSHEIRTPLNAVIGYMDMAKDATDDPEKMLHCVENTSVAAKHLLSIINDVLDMSSIESGKMKIAHADFSLREHVSELTTLFYHQAQAKGVHFAVRLCGVSEEWLVGDGLRLNQILMNLLSNAVKFTPADGTVTLTVTQLRCDEKQVFFRFDVSDTGIGISDEYKKRLFRPFEQESAATAQKYGGTGLGLSIANNLVGMLGGAMEVSSRQGCGTTFSVSLFFDRTENEHGARAQGFDCSGLRVLVADDNAESCEQTREMLRRCGVKCDAVSSGEDAVRQLRRRMDTEYRYDLCILDGSLSGMGGAETARAVRAACTGAQPVLVVAAYDVTACETGAKAAGADRVIAKPLFPSSLYDLLVTTYGRSAQSTALPARPAAMENLRVLLAEDNAMNLEIAVDILHKAGVQVDTAEDGKQAVDTFLAAEPGHYNAILMDVQMPVMDGYAATAAIRASAHPEAKTIPIIAMTANAFAEDVAAAQMGGMNGHIAKPIDRAKLFAVLGALDHGHTAPDGV